MLNSILDFSSRAVLVTAFAVFGYYLVGFCLALVVAVSANLLGAPEQVIALVPAVCMPAGAVLAGAAAWIGTRPWSPDRRRS